MPSPTTSDDDETPKKTAIPRRSIAVKRRTNATPNKRVPAIKAATPNSAPPRTKSGSKKAEPTLLGDFLLGRPSTNRARRRSLDPVRVEMRQSAVNKLQPPGAVKARVKQWQMASAAATIMDPSKPASEPDEILVHVEGESVNEQDRRDVKFRRQPLNLSRQKGGDNGCLQQPTTGKNSPKKRVVSDDHWMKNKPRRKSPPRPPKMAGNKTAGGRALPKDFFKMTSQDFSLEKKIEDWAKRTANEECSKEISPKNSTKEATRNGGRVSPSMAYPITDNMPVVLSRSASCDDGIRVKVVRSRERQLKGDASTEEQPSSTRRSGKPPPRSVNTRESRVISRGEAGSSEESDTNPTTPTRTLNSKARREGSSPPQESIADIPVGFSAFSVLDIPVGGEGRVVRPMKPLRTTSLSAVSKALKRVYTEGMKIVHDTVDPPRIGINQPPSIESWLNGTSDPFIDYPPIAEPVIEPVRPSSRRQSHEKNELRDRSTVSNEDETGTKYKNKPKEATKTPQNSNNGGYTPRKEFEVSTDSRSQNRDNIVGAKAAISPTGLKRSPATRSPSSPIKQSRKTPLRDMLADAFRGESEPHKPIESLTQPVESFQVLEEERRQPSRQVDAKSGSGSIAHNTEDAPFKTPPKERQRLPSLPKSEGPRMHENLSNVSCLEDTSTARHHRLSTTALAEAFNSLSPTEASSELSEAAFTRTTVNQTTSSNSNTSYTRDTESSISKQSSKCSGLKRRLTKHSDLLSVLSLPDAGASTKSKSMRSARSVRTTRSHLATATIQDLIRELADDEAKYARELKTLVDGVIPVLLTYVLSKSESVVATRLLNPYMAEGSDPTLTKPIVDMGVSLERLKSLHKRIPLHDLDQLVHWAHRAHKVYEDYLISWRMGFQNVIVNLAPASQSTLGEDQLLLDGMPRNANGDVLNEDGERVDVAFLLRRPLVRVKYLTKLINGICTIKPSDQAAILNEQFQALLAKTRRRMKEEEARLEDEAANNTDPTRARDPRTLAPMEGVKIDQTRQVNAKDLFDFSISHSSGQRLDCRIELILRDKPRDKADPGDVLICEVDTLGRWLLFPPIELSNISARSSYKKGELVVMIRGIQYTEEWFELFTLTTDEETALEWIQMLGRNPNPPSLKRANPSPISTVHSLPPRISASEVDKKNSAVNLKINSASGDLEVPIGERRGRGNGSHQSNCHDKQERRSPVTGRSRSSSRHPFSTKEEARSPIPAPRNLNEAMMAAGKQPDLELKQTGAKNYYSRHYSRSPTTPTSSNPRHECIELDHNSSHSSLGGTPFRIAQTGDSERSPATQHCSKKPGTESPSIPRLCKAQNSSTQENEKNRRLTDIERTDLAHLPFELVTEPKGALSNGDETPLPPPHRVQGPSTLKDPLNLSTPSPMLKSRRSSSPLKHEYQPSATSSISSVSESDTNDDASSESSSEEELEAADLLVPLPNLEAHTRRASPTGSFYSLPNTSLSPSNSASQVPYRGVPSQANMEKVRLVAAISYWSDKGYWVDLHPDVCSIIVSAGLIEAFVLDEMCSASNGNKEVASSSDTNTDASALPERPLVALELTPVVPLRQSTAVDIEIRSPPTARSTAKCTHTVRFRSRTLQECSALYAAIHSARMKNPVYLKLEQERILNSYGSRPYEAAVSAGRRRSWFGRTKSYRVSARAPSDTISEDTTNSFSSAISRLRNLGGLGSFNIAKSSIDTSQGGLSGIRFGETSLDTSSASSATSGITPPRTPASLSAAPNGLPSLVSLGSSNLKIRLYILETSSKWNELGNALLTVTHPPRGMRQASSLYHGVEKRIIVKRDVSSKKNIVRRSGGQEIQSGEDGNDPVTILDVVLGGGCFSRLGVVGIAMNVWEDIVGDNGEIGMIGAIGGVSGRTRKWMFQCASAAEARWIFALVGGGTR